VRETSAVAERPRFRVRRDKVKSLLPEDVQSAADLAAFFKISRTTAWRLFCADPDSAAARRVGSDYVAAICAKFPDVPQDELVEVETRSAA
jgi:hypothetical protein